MSRARVRPSQPVSVTISIASPDSVGTTISSDGLRRDHPCGDDFVRRIVIGVVDDASIWPRIESLPGMYSGVSLPNPAGMTMARVTGSSWAPVAGSISSPVIGWTDSRFPGG